MNSIRFLVRLAVAVIAFTTFTVAANAQDWVARHAMSQAQFQSTFNDLYAKGFRLKCLSGYMSGGVELYAALWTKESGPAWQARSNMTEADFQKATQRIYRAGRSSSRLILNVIKGGQAADAR